MDHDAAERVLKAMAEIDAGFHSAFLALKETGEQDAEGHRLKKRLANLLALIGSGVYREIYHHHPDLCPCGMRFMLDRAPEESDWPFPD